MFQASFIDGATLAVRQILCVGHNYATHVREMGLSVPSVPAVFMKPLGTLIQDGGCVALPRVSAEVHHELELVVLIGKGGKRIHPEHALDHVVGYGVGIDVTARDIQREAKSSGAPWTVAKGFDTFAPISAFVPPHRIPDPGAIAFALEVNGAVRQRGSSSDMLFTLAELITYLSSIFTLQPGDLIFTGTPSGVGPLKRGDRLRAWIEPGVPELRVSVGDGAL